MQQPLRHYTCNYLVLEKKEPSYLQSVRNHDIWCSQVWSAIHVMYLVNFLSEVIQIPDVRLFSFL